MLRRLALNNAFLAIQYLAAGLVPLLLIPHIVRQIGLSNYGTLAVALAWANYAALVVNYAFTLSGPSRLANPRPTEIPGDIFAQIFSGKATLLASVSLTAMLGFVVASAMGASLRNAHLWIILALPLASALHAGWYLQSTGQFSKVSVASIVGVCGALAIGFWPFSPDLYPAITQAAIALTIAPLIAGLITFFLSTRHLIVQGDRLRWLNPRRELLQGWPLFVSQMMAALYSTSGPIIVGHFVSYQDAGAYSAVERIANAVVGACLLTHTAAYPTLARLFHSDRLAYRRLLSMVIATYIVIASLVIIVVTMTWNSVLGWLLGQHGPTYDLLLASALAWVFIGIFGSAVTGYLTVSGRGDRVLPLTLWVLFVSVLLGVPGILLYGAWAWLASLCIAQIAVVATFWQLLTNERFHKGGSLI